MLGLGLGDGARLVAGGLTEGVRDTVGILIDGLDEPDEDDLPRSNEGLDGIAGADLGLMEGLVLPGLMEGLGRLGEIERLELDPVDPRLLLIRSSSDPRFELPDWPITDGLRRLGIDRPPR